MSEWQRSRLALESASTLPPAAYTDPALYQHEMEALLRREWLCAGRVDQVPAAGDFVTLDLLGERLMMVRDKAGAIHVLSRIGRHRAAELVTGSGHANSFSCPYHAWTYGLDGALVGAPLMDGLKGFDKEACRLPSLRSEVWQGWVFVNFDPEAKPLGPALAPLAKRLVGYGMADMVASETAVYPSAFNWKVLVDNFMEAYHHIAIHRSTFEPIFPARQSYVPDNEGPYSVLVMPQKQGASPDSGPLGKDDLVACVVYPFHLFAPGAEVLTWYQLFPESVDAFTLRIYSCFPRAVLDDPKQKAKVEEAKALTRHIHEEDIAACDAVWKGLCTPDVEQGRLSLLEKALWQFNQWWLERMPINERCHSLPVR